jgi:hypothetical protein
MKLKTKNIWINQLRIENIKIKIESSEPELSKNNNEIVLEKL